MKPQAKVVVVGAGVIGVCCAYFLAKRGASVVVLERDEIACGSSYGNAGTIAPGHGPINKPGRIRQALRSLFDPLSPLYVAPRWDPSLLRWFWSFSRNCSARHLDYAMRALAPLGRATPELFDRLIADETLDCGYRREGYYEVYLTESRLEAATWEAGLMRRHGFQPEVLDGAALREREPALKRTVLGGVFNPQAATLNPHRFVLELAERARRYGAAFRCGSPVVDVLQRAGIVQGARTEDGEFHPADSVVLATGAYSLDLIRKHGVDLPLQAGKGYHRDRLPREGETPALRNTCMLGETSVFCTPMDGFVRFAGTLEFSGVNHDMHRPRLEQLTNAAQRYLDGMGDGEPTSEWCGLRPCIADGLPVLGPVPNVKGLFVATGHAMLGLTLGPVTGKLVAEYVLEGKPSIDLSALRVDRF